MDFRYKKAKLKLEIVDFLHKKFMKSRDLEEMSLIEEMQREILK